MMYMEKRILLLVILLPIPIEMIIHSNLNYSNGNKTVQQIFRNINSLQIRTIVLILEREEYCEDILTELNLLAVPIYIISIYDEEVNTIYTPDHESYFDNLKLFLVYQVYLNITIIKKTVDYIKRIQFWKNRERIVFLTNLSPVVKDTVLNLFEVCFRNWMLNVALVPLNKNSEVYMLNPYGNNFVRRGPTLTFRDNLLNLKGSEINISLFHEPVYANRKGDSFLGRDAEVAKTVVKFMNASCNYLTPEDGETFGIFNETYMSGVIKDTILNITQIALNNRLLVNSYNRVEFTNSHARNDLIILIPKSRNEKTLIEIIPRLVWPTLAILSGLIILFFLTTTKYTYCYILLITVLIITGRPLKELNIKYFRLLYMSAMVVVIFINTIICCSVSSFSTVPQFEKEIETIHQFVRTGYNIVTTEKAKSILERVLDDESRPKILSKIELISSPRQLQEILKCKPRAVICKDGLANLAFDKGATNCYTKLKQHVMPSLVAYLVGYGSPLLSSFNKIIRRIFESGLHLFWEPHSTVEQYEENLTQISLNFLLIAFQIYVFGNLLASITFLCEITIFKYVNFKCRRLGDITT